MNELLSTVRFFELRTIYLYNCTLQRAFVDLIKRACNTEIYHTVHSCLNWLFNQHANVLIFHPLKRYRVLNKLLLYFYKVSGLHSQ